MMKKILLFSILFLVLFSLTNCEYYTTTANKLFDYRGEVPDPVNTTPYENFEVEQQLALRADHVTIMFSRNLEIGPTKDCEYIGVTGGEGGLSTAFILLAASNGGNTANWPTPSKDSTVWCQKLGTYAGTSVWGVVIPRSYFVNTLQDDVNLVFSWKFVWSEGSWDDSKQQAGVAPFINPADYNNCTAKLNALTYADAQNF